MDIRYSHYLAAYERLQQERVDTSPPFLLMVVLALSFHVLLLSALNYLAERDDTFVPERTIRLKIGQTIVPVTSSISAASKSRSEETGSSDQKMQAMMDNMLSEKKAERKAAVKPARKRETVSKRSEPRTPRNAKSVTSARSAGNRPRSRPALATVRKNTAPAAGNPLGNSTASDAEIARRYTQTLSAWVERYEPDIRVPGREGETLKVVVYIRIDRLGILRKRSIYTSSGIEEVDRKALESFDRASPFPKPPADYNGTLAFRIAMFIDMK
jgi:protein TonB